MVVSANLHDAAMNRIIEYQQSIENDRLINRKEARVVPAFDMMPRYDTPEASQIIIQFVPKANANGDWLILRPRFASPQ